MYNRHSVACNDMYKIACIKVLQPCSNAIAGQILREMRLSAVTHADGRNKIRGQGSGVRVTKLSRRSICRIYGACTDFRVQSMYLPSITGLHAARLYACSMHVHRLGSLDGGAPQSPKSLAPGTVDSSGQGVVSCWLVQQDFNLVLRKPHMA